MKTLAVLAIGWAVLGWGCAKAQVVRSSPAPPVTVTRDAASPAVPSPPAVGPVAATLPDALLEGVEKPRRSKREFRGPARRYTLVMAGADARELFLSLARENDFNLVLSPEVSGTVTMDIKEATAEELMDEVCGMLACRVAYTGDTIRITPAMRVTRVFPVDYLITTRTGQGSLMASTSASGGGSGVSTTTSESQSTNSIVTEEKGDFWAGLSEEVGALLSPGSAKVVVNRTAGTLTVTDYPENIARVERYLRMLEARVRAGVIIETRIFEVTLDDSTQYGINWSALPDLSSISLSGSLPGGATAAQSLASGTTAFQVGVAGTKFNAFLDALAQSGNLNVLSAPKVSTLNNQKAIIRIGRQDVFFRAVVTPASTNSAAFTTFTPDSVTEGIILSVTPQVGRDGRVMLAIHPSITEKVGEAKAPDGNTAPILDVRETSTVVSVADGQTVFIGGLMQERTQETVNSVPLLGDIPYLGALFRNNLQEKKKTELVILITPRVVGTGEGAEAAAEEQERLRDTRRGYHLGGRPWLYGTGGERGSLRPWN